MLYERPGFALHAHFWPIFLRPGTYATGGRNCISVARTLEVYVGHMLCLGSCGEANAALASNSPRSFLTRFLRLRYQHTAPMTMQRIAAIVTPVVVHAAVPIPTPPSLDASAAAPSPILSGGVLGRSPPTPISAGGMLCASVNSPDWKSRNYSTFNKCAVHRANTCVRYWRGGCFYVRLVFSRTLGARAVGWGERVTTRLNQPGGGERLGG